MVNIRALEPGTEPYVLPIQCEQVFYSQVPGKTGCSYIVRYDPRGRPVKYNLVEEEENVEEEGDVDQEKLALAYVLDQESNQEVDNPNDVEDDFELGDDIDDEYITEK